MSTWHQRQAPTPLWSKDTWNVVVDPPNGLTYVIPCKTFAEADEVQKKHKHSYVLRPEPEGET